MATAITGNTFPFKAEIKALGGRWNADAKAWMVPDERAAEVRALISGAPKVAPSSDKPRYRPTRCGECGVRAGRYTRIYGYTDATALCGPCFGDRRDND